MEKVEFQDAEGKENTTSRDADNEGKFLMHALRAIIKKWWLFAIVGLIAGIVGYLQAAKKKTVYESYLSFAMDEGGSEGGMSGAMGIAAQFGISLGGAKDVFTGDNILAIMLSRRIIENSLLSVDTFNNKPYTFLEYYLETEVNLNKGSKSDIHFYPGDTRNQLTHPKDSLLYESYLEFTKNKIFARRPNKKLNIYELSVTSYDEKFSKKFTDRLIERTVSFYSEITSKKAKSTLEILESRVPVMKGKLDATIDTRAAIQDANLNTAFARAQVPLLKAQSNGQVYGAAYSEMYKNLEMARFQYLKSIPLIQVIDEANYPMKNIKPGKLKTAIVFSIIACFLLFLIIFFLNIVRFKSIDKLTYKK